MHLIVYHNTYHRPICCRRLERRLATDRYIYKTRWPYRASCAVIGQLYQVVLETADYSGL